MLVVSLIMNHTKFLVDSHGVGVSVVNALSEKLILKIFRDKKEYFVEFKNGKALSPLKVKGKANKTGNFYKFFTIKSSIF